MHYDGKRPQAHVANMVVDTVNERVGIGTNNPSKKLEVNGTVRTKGTTNDIDINNTVQPSDTTLEISHDVNATGYWVNNTRGFTGTSSYSSFTIVDGIITSAS